MEGEDEDKEHNGVPALGLHMERLGDKGDTAYVLSLIHIYVDCDCRILAYQSCGF